MECESYGVRYDRKPNAHYDTRRLMNCSYPRGAGSAIGGSIRMMEIMMKTVYGKGIQVFKHIMVTRLLKNNSRVVGAFGLN